MDCYSQQKRMIIVKGDDTGFNNKKFISINISSQTLNLQTLTAKLELCGVTKTFTDLTQELVVNYTALETSTFPLGNQNGILRFFDSQSRRETLTSVLPFKIIGIVTKGMEITNEYTLTFDIKDNYSYTLDIEVTANITDHNSLLGRDDPNCHTVGAITGLQAALNSKQDVIEDLSTIRAGAALGATALQPSALNNTTLTGNTTAEALKIDGYNALTTNSALDGTKLNEKTVSKDALTQSVQDSLEKADSAVQTIETGTTDGTISVDGNEVEVAGLGSAAFTDTDEYATASQGQKADTALQPNDNISEMTNNADYQTGTQVSESIGTHNTSTTAHNDIRQAISGEANTRSSADQNLQQQIDAIVSASDVTDIVGTYAELQAYDTSGLANNSIIKVLQDESRDDETTYYRWVITDNIGSWRLIGEEGPYYTKSQADNKFVPQTTTINNKALSGNITLNAQDVGAQAALTVGAGIDITNGTISNTGVQSMATGSTNGTVAVNTGGTSAEVAVAGLESAAYTPASDYATAAQGAKADTAVQPAAIANMQTTTNLVTSISGSSTDAQYPSAKCMWTLVGDVESLINAL